MAAPSYSEVPQLIDLVTPDNSPISHSSGVNPYDRDIDRDDTYVYEACLELVSTFSPADKRDYKCPKFNSVSAFTILLQILLPLSTADYEFERFWRKKNMFEVRPSIPAIRHLAKMLQEAQASGGDEGDRIIRLCDKYIARLVPRFWVLDRRPLCGVYYLEIYVEDVKKYVLE